MLMAKIKRDRKNLYTVFVAVVVFTVQTAYAQPEFPIQLPQDAGSMTASLQLIFLLTILSLAPALLIMMTSFTRIIITLSFLRNALGTQQMPPNQILIGLALFLTFFIMAPIAGKINTDALQPYLQEEIEQDVAINNTITPLKEFMLKYTREKDIGLFLTLSQTNNAENDTNDLPMKIVIPAFIISELKTAFQMGFVIYVPFLVIDMVVASTLMSMGMMMLPPIMISLPFKILLFVMVDGWNLVVQSIVTSFKL